MDNKSNRSSNSVCDLVPITAAIRSENVERRTVDTSSNVPAIHSSSHFVIHFRSMVAMWSDT